jgi:hypothetical protein
MKKLLSGFVTFLLISWLPAKGSHEHTTPEPDTIDAKSCATVLMRRDSLVIRSRQMASLYVKERIEVLPGGEEAGVLQMHTSTYQKAVFQGGMLLLPDGTTRKIEKKNLLIRSAFSSFSLFEDHQILYYEPDVLPPYTIEYSYEYELTGLLFLPAWIPQYSSCIAVKSAHLDVSFPDSAKVKFFLPLLRAPIQRKDRKSGCHFSVQDLRPFYPEPQGPEMIDQIPVVFLAMQKFILDGRAGSSLSWADLGVWQAGLMAGTSKLNPELLAFAQSVKDSYPEPADRIRVIYEKMQRSKRYVSIQVGIGSWKPFAVTEVEKTGYGDCKALSNYVASLLNAAGIKAYCALIRAGESPRAFYPEFPSMQFNHMIVCIPGSSDTTWLECTNMLCAPGHLGTFTSGRPALLITPEGGKLVNTPPLDYSRNFLVTHSEVNVSASGQLEVTEHSTHKGAFYDNCIPHLTERESDINNAVLREYGISGMDILSCTFIPDTRQPAAIHQSTKFNVKRYATVMGKRIFLVPNIHNRFLQEVDLTSRKTAYVRHAGEAMTDTTEFKFAVPVTAEHIPENVSFSGPAGNYSRSIICEGNTLFYIRKAEFAAGVWEPSQLEDLILFYNRVSTLDQEQVILKFQE